MSIALSDAQRLDWLQLIRCGNVGPRTFVALINRFGGAGNALAALPGLIAAAKTGRVVTMASRADAEQEMAQAARAGVRFVAVGEADYPAALRAIDAAPPLLAMRGNFAAAAKPGVALVGSRNASAAGITFAERLARGLGYEGFVTVSGCARGIDAAVHRASIETGTIAVLAGGHARPYPADHVPLIDAIAERGLVVSEMPFNWEPRGRDFPRRNRLVSGLALGTIVVEAARRSGSLITARFAIEQGREVFAVPGSPLDPRAEGVNDLLREGATLCTRLEDVVANLAPLVAEQRIPGGLFREDDAVEKQESLWDEADLFGRKFPEPPTFGADHELDEPETRRIAREAMTERHAPDAPPQQSVESLLGPSPISVDDLVRISRLPVAHVQDALLALELGGRLERHGGNLVSLIA